MATAKKPAAKKTPDTVTKVERSARVLTEIYAWTATIHPQGESLRYLEVVGTDGKQAFRVMNLNAEVAQQLADMLVPQPTE